MKATLVLAAGASLAAAQSLASLPACGQTCISNMIDIAQSSLGCSSNNATCFCCHPEFGYGIRDCANEACSSSDSSSVIQYGVQYCASALPSGASCPSSSDTASASATASATPSYPMTGVLPGSTGGSSPGSGAVVPINGGLAGYSVANTTITAGGPVAVASGTTYSALPSDSGVVGVGGDTTTTVSGSSAASTGLMPGAGISGSSTSGAAATSSGSDSTATSSTGAGTGTGSGSGSGAAGGASTSSQGGAAFPTAAPGLIGAAAIALLAL